MQSRIPTAEVVGAGLSGLFAATMLGQRGWKVTVHERGSELREIGAGIGMWANGLWALRSLGLYDRVVAAGQPVDRWELYDERKRRLQGKWMAPEMSAGECTVLRSELHGLLATGAKECGVEVRTNSRVVRATPEGEILLEDGSSRHADLVVGADGVNSVVRDSLALANRVLDVRDGAGRHLIERRPGERDRVLAEYWSGSRRLGVVPVTDDLLYVYLCCRADDLAGVAQHEDRSSWSYAFPDLEDIVTRIQDGTPWAPFANVSVSSWSRGVTAIVGDAAHAMPPSLGQAANVAFANVAALGQALDLYPADVPRALKVWEQTQRRVADAVQRSSYLYGRINTDWPQDFYAARSLMVWGLSKSVKVQKMVNAGLYHRPDIQHDAPTIADPVGSRRVIR